MRAAYGSNRRRVSAALAWSPSTNAASPLASKGSMVADPGASKPRALSANRRRPSASPAVARASAACMPRNVNGTPSIRPRASSLTGGFTGSVPGGVWPSSWQRHSSDGPSMSRPPIADPPHSG